MKFLIPLLLSGYTVLAASGGGGISSGGSAVGTVTNLTGGSGITVTPGNPITISQDGTLATISDVNNSSNVLAAADAADRTAMTNAIRVLAPLTNATLVRPTIAPPVYEFNQPAAGTAYQSSWLLPYFNLTQAPAPFAGWFPYSTNHAGQMGFNLPTTHFTGYKTNILSLTFGTTNNVSVSMNLTLQLWTTNGPATTLQNDVSKSITAPSGTNTVTLSWTNTTATAWSAVSATSLRFYDNTSASGTCIWFLKGALQVVE